jgi:hypothetical protein
MPEADPVTTVVVIGHPLQLYSEGDPMAFSKMLEHPLRALFLASSEGLKTGFRKPLGHTGFQDTIANVIASSGLV